MTATTEEPICPRPRIRMISGDSRGSPGTPTIIISGLEPQPGSLRTAHCSTRGHRTPSPMTATTKATTCAPSRLNTKFCLNPIAWSPGVLARGPRQLLLLLLALPSVGRDLRHRLRLRGRPLLRPGEASDWSIMITKASDDWSGQL